MTAGGVASTFRAYRGIADFQGPDASPPYFVGGFVKPLIFEGSLTATVPAGRSLDVEIESRGLTLSPTPARVRPWSWSVYSTIDTAQVPGRSVALLKLPTTGVRPLMRVYGRLG